MNGEMIKFKKRIEKEYNYYRQIVQSLDKDEIYELWYKNGVFDTYYGLLTDDFFQEDSYKDLREWLDKKENILNFIYDEWVKTDYCICIPDYEMIDWLWSRYYWHLYK